MGRFLVGIRPGWLVAIAALASLVAMLAHVSPSRATTPGTNGTVLFNRTEDLWSMDAGGAGELSRGGQTLLDRSLTPTQSSAARRIVQNEYAMPLWSPGWSGRESV